MKRELVLNDQLDEFWRMKSSSESPGTLACKFETQLLSGACNVTRGFKTFWQLYMDWIEVKCFIKLFDSLKHIKMNLERSFKFIQKQDKAFGVCHTQMIISINIIMEWVIIICILNIFMGEMVYLHVKFLFRIVVILLKWQVSCVSQLERKLVAVKLSNLF